ncbi:hypothetical protein J40TS1_26380 [Paenibacillus montaniterrae]|uniref:Spore germination protein n=1 Tax=Paenibacillus montaniterrae TaxID=429341 RepID=A0A919YRF9_9BACL|nr:GerAB/ArcD/ProY family transporter [Paenibacillus montaniterrae]GIP16996.1 hypothetical protein J40TS1_26380 [Paenibacillus montaniterrae]
MNRYVFYHYFIVCFTNLMLLVPYHLISDRFDGAVMAILISPIVGGILFYMLTNAINKFPGKGLPEIISMYYPTWFVRIFLVYKAMLTGFASALVVSSYTVIVTRFLNPDANPYIILMVLMLVCAYGATRSTASVNFLLEIVLIINIPGVAFVIYKTFTNPLLNWDAIHIVADHVAQAPSLVSFASASFVFTGFLNLLIFNRLLPANFKFKFRWLITLSAFFILLITFFLPIGIHGTETVSQYLYLWSATADSTRMNFGFIERMLFVFIIVLMNNAVAFTIVGWHISIEYMRGALPNNVIDPDEPEPHVYSYYVVVGIVLITLILKFLIDEMKVLQLGGYFLILRLFSEAVTTIWLFLLSRKKVRKYAKNDAA